MTSLATAFVTAKLDTSSFGTDIKRGMAHPSVPSSMKDSGKAAGKGFTSAFGSALKIGGVLAGAFVATKGVAFLKDAITAGSDLAETANKIDVVFGRGAGAVERFAKGAATRLGESQLAATNAAAGFGVFGKAAGLTGAENAKFSTKLVKLSADMASFSNTSPEQAVEALGSALRGESEPIRAYGVLLDEASLKAEAVAKGIIKPVKNLAAIKLDQANAINLQKAYNEAVAESGKGSFEAVKAQAALGSAQAKLSKDTEGTVPALTQQQKVLAATSLITKQTKDAQGDFGRTSEGLANQQRILTASFEDVKAKVGTALLPVMTDLIHFVNEKALPALSSLGDFVKHNWDVIKPLVVVLGGAAAALGIVAAATAAWTAVLALNPVTIIVVAIAALAAGLVIAYKRSETFRDIVDGAFDVVKGAMVATGDAAMAFLGFMRSMAAGAIDMVASLIDAFATFVDGVLSAFGAVVDGADSAFGWIPGIGDDIGNAKDAFHTFAEATVNNLHDVADGLNGVADDVRDMPDPTIDTRKAEVNVKRLARTIYNSLHGIEDEDIRVELSTTAADTIALFAKLNPFGAAAGGRVFGRGTGTSDEIPALLSNGEHIITADEVKKAGGHRVWEGLRRLAKRGALLKTGDIGGYADGGAVIPNVYEQGAGAAASGIAAQVRSLASGISAKISDAVNKYMTEMPSSGGGIGALGTSGSLTPAQIVRGQGFAKSQSGKPYQWGGIGNPSWDCSGFVGGVLLSALGQSPYQRIGTTASMPWKGFSPGTGTFTVGNDPGSHMAGVIGGLGIESNGYWGVKAGSLETPLNTFADTWKYDNGGILKPGYTLAYNGTGMDEYVSKFASGGAVDLDAEQRRIARTIIAVGTSMGMTKRDIKIGIMTALQESGMRNLHYGDADSQGVFQQRPSMGWGTAAQVTDPEYAAKKFFAALKGVSDREGMKMWQAAQAVQRSANGALYADDRLTAQGIVAELGGAGGGRRGGGRGGHAAADDGPTKAEEAAAAAAAAMREAVRNLTQTFKHFGWGEHATRDVIKDQLQTLTGALVGVFGKDGHIVKAVKATAASLLGVARTHDRVLRQIDAGNANLARLIGDQKALQRDIASGFDTTVFGEGGQQTAQGLFMSARAEINDARHFKRVLKKLKAKGLAPSILKALALAGPSAIVQAEALAALSSKKLNQYEDLLQQGNQVELGLGGVVSSVAYNPQIAAQRKELRDNNEQLRHLNQRMGNLDDRIERAVERALRHIHVDLDGKRVDRALADHTHRRQRTSS